MSYAANLWLFFVLLFGIILVPGMDSLFVLANGLNGGRKAGLAAVAGIVAGGVFHSVYGVFGAGLVAQKLPALYLVMLLAGGGYMLWIGFSLIRSSIRVDHVPDELITRRGWWGIFRQGMITCLLNPKAYLFTLAVFPQYIKPAYGPLWAQAVVMGLMVAGTQLGVYGSLALAAGKARSFLLGKPQATVWTGRIAGAVLIVVTLLTLWNGLSGHW
ncbi:LysE family translocator [Gellertiella hungarica]|uniref:Threonine/homoserine/homoserine lactone efflux protein n=1 Tax=Gellertiella hungarica TaxID=1572859 RepID=A0A7W6J2D4_9HYPH|nr:LysE family translocator [Gellertiella hungarica]MBB4063499.1 threonine/homoserine/homoserine lactone efflux protein [Gellertiella hungarica]